LQEAAATQYYRGSIGTSPVRLILEEKAGRLIGLLFHEQQGIPYLVRGVDSAGTIILEEYLDKKSYFTDSTLKWPQLKTGQLKCVKSGKELNGVWHQAQSAKQLTVILSLVEEARPSPEAMAELLQSASNSMEIITLLGRWLVGVSPSLFYVPQHTEPGTGSVIPGSLLQPGFVLGYSEKVQYKGKDLELFVLFIQDIRLATFCFSLDGDRWKVGKNWTLVQLEKRHSFVSNEFWREEMPLKYRLVRICNDSYMIEVLKNRILSDAGPVSTRCTELSVFRITPDEFEQIIQTETYRWQNIMNSQTEIPVEVEYDFISSDDWSYSTSLELEITQFRLEPGVDSRGKPITRAKRVGSTEQVIELCE
jgi:hypothetical protein